MKTEQTAITERLRRVPLFAHLSEADFAENVRGTELRLRHGTYLAHEGDLPGDFYILLEGRIEWTRRVGPQQVHVDTSDPADQEPFWGHELILSETPYPVSGRALTDVYVYKLEPDSFWRMIGSCRLIMRSLLTTAAQRWGNVYAVSQQHARLASLGTLAAGLAHELNNPAAAAKRAVEGLHHSFETSQSLVFRLLEGGVISPKCLAEIGCEVRERAGAASPLLSVLERSDREDEIASWLEAREIAGAWEMAPTLSGAGLDMLWLQSLAVRAPASVLADLLSWIAATLTTGDLLGEVAGCTGRISSLVKAVKDYSYVDQAPLQEINVHDGLESTLTMLAHKIREKDITVIRAYEADVPRICAYGSELNQVWTNLIDNAIDALKGPPQGRIILRTASESGDRVRVEVEDTGPGIATEIQHRIFEPFFTTKGVGRGTGLGLDISRRIIEERHGGDIRFESIPGGGTCFQVRLPSLFPRGKPMLHDPKEPALFPRLTADEIEHLRRHGREIALSAGDTIFTEGEVGYHFYVVLEGEIKITKQVNGKETVLTIHQPGEFTGEISMMTRAPAIATGRSLGESRVLEIEPETFRRILAECSETTGVIVSAMAERAKDVSAQLQQQEKLAALGKLSAGLAHELNNPAAAGKRAAGQLRRMVQDALQDALEHDVRFSPEQRALLSELRAEAPPEPTALDPLTQSDREDEMGEWLDDHGVENGWEITPTLVSFGFERGRLDALADELDAETLPHALRWLDTTLATGCLLREVEQSATRISELVGAIKEYTFMDRGAAQEVDVHTGLESTLTILGHKLKRGSITVERDYDRTLPCICAHGSELNQVWTNLIDNAIDAMAGKGQLTLRTRREDNSLIVEVADSGPGIPAAVQSRIFDPFFTTKGVGEGTGLGLDIARRIIRTHDGDMRVFSQPGNTRFQVSLPIQKTP